MTLQIPKIPPTKKGFTFSRVEQHQLKKELAAEIRSLLIDMRKATIIPGYQDMYNKFLNAIDPGTTQDLTRLPYPTHGPNDTKGSTATRMGCVYARLSWIIRLYWALCLDGHEYNASAIRRYISELRKIVAHGIEKCAINGDVGSGFYLEAPE